MDPVENFIEQLRPSLRRYQEQFERGEITGIAINGRNDRRQRSDRWCVSVQPQTDEKVIRAWAVDEGRIRAIK